MVTTGMPHSVSRSMRVCWEEAGESTTPASFSAAATSRYCDSLARSSSAFASRTENPAAWAASSTPRTMEVKNGLVMSEMIKPTTAAALVRRLRAAPFGR